MREGTVRDVKHAALPLLFAARSARLLSCNGREFVV